MGDHGDVPYLVDRFVIEDELGAGGMGRVFLAYDPSLDRRVALKVLHGGDQERLVREARAMAKLRHPNVVTVHEVGVHDGRVYLVMEYVAGGTLREWVRRTPDAGWREIVARYVLAGHGLAAAHAAGLVHRDFKPDNVLVGDDGRVLVSDFGLDGGTPAYMAPEQHLGRAADASSDQFAFCAALYEALFGVRPFAGDTPDAIAARALRAELAPPAIDRGVPSAIAAAVRRGLAATAADRYPSLPALLDALSVRRASPVPWLAVAAAGVLALGLATRDRGAPPPVAIAIEPIRIAMLGNPPRPEWDDAAGDILAVLLGDIDGVTAVGPTYLLGTDALREARDRTLAAPALLAAERRANAGYVVRGGIDEHGDRLHAHLTVAAPTWAQTIELERPHDQLARLLDDATDALAHAIDPQHDRDRRPAHNRARALFAIGNDHLRAADYQAARPFLDQAIDADPSYFDAWNALALARSWVLAPEAQVTAALDAARSTAPTAIERRLVDGAAHLFHHELAAARATLEPLAGDPTLSPIEQRDALYLLGEAHWHDGHHKVGVGYLQRALDVDLRFKPAVQHVAEYAIANRDQATIQQYAALLVTSSGDLRGATDFVLGRYEELAHGTSPTRWYATIVLGRTLAPDMEAELAKNPIDLHTWRAARAFELGETAAATAELDAVWADIRARGDDLSDATYFSLGLIGDIALCAGATAEVRRIVEFLAAHSRAHPVRGYQRLSILAAPLVGDRTWVIRAALTDRDRQLADAIDAELAGDRGRAVALLQAIVGDPSPSWDYPERMALLRNLRALHRTADARALCEDTLRPAIFQWAFLPARRACRD